MRVLARGALSGWSVGLAACSVVRSVGFDGRWMRWWLVRSVLWAGQSVGVPLLVSVGSFTMDLGLAVRVDPGVNPGGIRGDPVLFGWILQVLTM